MIVFDAYDKINSVAASEGWTERTQIRILCEFIESMTPEIYGYTPELFDKWIERKNRKNHKRTMGNNEQKWF